MVDMNATMPERATKAAVGRLDGWVLNSAHICKSFQFSETAAAERATLIGVRYSAKKSRELLIRAAGSTIEFMVPVTKGATRGHINFVRLLDRVIGEARTWRG